MKLQHCTLLNVSLIFLKNHVLMKLLPNKDFTFFKWIVRHTLSFKGIQWFFKIFRLWCNLFQRNCTGIKVLVTPFLTILCWNYVKRINIWYSSFVHVYVSSSFTPKWLWCAFEQGHHPHFHHKHRRDVFFFNYSTLQISHYWLLSPSHNFI